MAWDLSIADQNSSSSTPAAGPGSSRRKILQGRRPISDEPRKCLGTSKRSRPLSVSLQAAHPTSARQDRTCGARREDLAATTAESSSSRTYPPRRPRLRRRQHASPRCAAPWRGLHLVSQCTRTARTSTIVRASTKGTRSGDLENWSRRRPLARVRDVRPIWSRLLKGSGRRRRLVKLFVTAHGRLDEVLGRDNEAAAMRGRLEASEASDGQLSRLNIPTATGSVFLSNSIRRSRPRWTAAASRVRGEATTSTRLDLPDFCAGDPHLRRSKGLMETRRSTMTTCESVNGPYGQRDPRDVEACVSPHELGGSCDAPHRRAKRVHVAFCLVRHCDRSSAPVSADLWASTSLRGWAHSRHCDSPGSTGRVGLRDTPHPHRCRFVAQHSCSRTQVHGGPVRRWLVSFWKGSSFALSERSGDDPVYHRDSASTKDRTGGPSLDAEGLSPHGGHASPEPLLAQGRRRLALSYAGASAAVW